MLCIPKKNGTLRTMFDLRQQNKNTWKDIMPFPDQDAIHHDIVRAKFRSKLDMTEAYEQTVIIYALTDRLTISLTNDNPIPFSSNTHGSSRSGDPESY